jgi:hypothetical protein
MTRKILLSLLVIVAVVAAIGLITFAIFSDNIASDEQEFLAGDVDIVVNEQEEFFETTLDMFNMEPGDCETQTVVVRNKGSLPVDLWNWIYTWRPSVNPGLTLPGGMIWDDVPNIFACDPNDDCNMYVAKTLVDQSGEPDEKLYPDCNHPKYALGPEYGCVPGGGWEEYELEACFPLCAGNLCQNAYGKVRIFFHAVQQSNLEDGWNCVKLMYKEAPDWIPDPTIPAHGNKCYQDEVGAGPDVDFVVNGYDLTPNMPLQIMLNGPGGCSVEDSIIAGDFDLDGTVDAGHYDAYYRGFWTGSAMSNVCSGTGEGVYAIAWGGDYHLTGDPAAVTDGDGNFSGQWTAHLDACASQNGTYELQTKFLVKQDASPWLEELDELDYQYITFDCP